jgi:hypothetical protein
VDDVKDVDNGPSLDSKVVMQLRSSSSSFIKGHGCSIELVLVEVLNVTRRMRSMS